MKTYAIINQQQTPQPVSKNRKLLPLIALIGLSASLLSLKSASAYGIAYEVNTNETETINFDTVTVTNGSGADPTSYLASYGITLTNVSNPGTVTIDSDQYYTYLAASSENNFLLQQVGGSPNGISYTLDFNNPLSSLSFVRIASTAANLVAQWTATAYVGTNAVDSVGESLSGGTSSAETFDLSGDGITSVTISANGYNEAGISSAPIDNLTITPQSVPEPSTYALFGLGALVLIAAQRRRMSV